MAAPYCQNQSDSMTSDFKRRVERNTALKYQNALSPLFEAIMNSVDAIHERNDNKPGDGKIVIDIERDDSQGLLEDHQHHIEAHPVRSFKVHDNGIGVTDPHFEAFGIADTPYRSAQGGKGVGRLIWLKAFDHAEIKSVFQQGKQKLLRTFNLCLTAQGIEQPQVRTATETDGSIGTEIRLCNYHSEYQKEVPKSAAAIANRIIEYFLKYFVLGEMPQISIIDAGSVYALNDIFVREVGQNARSNASFNADGQQFTVGHFLVASSFQGAHRLYFCSNNKMVISKPLANRVPNLGGSVHSDGRTLVYAGYVSGKYLDACSNAERTSFDISDDDSSFSPGWDTILRESIHQARVFLDPYTMQAKQSKEDRIRTFTQKTAPQYRLVVNRRPDLVDTISPNVTDDKLDLELHRIDHIYQSDLDTRAAGVLQSLQSGVTDWEAFRAQYDRFLEEWNEAGISKLAQHVVHRRATIDFFKASLRKNAHSGKYLLEEAIHRIIFPLRCTSDELWQVR